MKTPVYLEIDEDITSAIDKLTAAEGSDVWLVVPKRSTLLHSIVNLKLLKKAATESGKDLTLVTTDKTALHLAGRTSLAVAESLAVEAKKSEPLESKPLRETEILAESPDADIKPIEPKPKTLNKPARIPDFARLQRRLLWAGLGLLALGIFWGFNNFYSRADVNVFVESKTANTSFDFKLNPNAAISDIEKGELATSTLSVEKNLSGAFNATGKKDVGTKARGEVTIYNCYSASAINLPAGTNLSGPSGLLFVTTQPANLEGASFASGCSQSKVKAEATASGDKYNLAKTTYPDSYYRVNNYPTSGTYYLYAQGGQMSGGTTKEITVVSQQDIEQAEKTLIDQISAEAKKETLAKATEQSVTIKESWLAQPTEQKVSPALDEEASSATMSMKVKFSLLSVFKEDLNNLIRNRATAKIATGDVVYDINLDSAKFTLNDVSSEGIRPAKFSGEYYYGSRLNKTDLAKQLTNRRYGDGINLVSKIPGVERVEINLWPFWISRTPRAASRINVDIKVSGLTN